MTAERWLVCDFCPPKGEDGNEWPESAFVGTGAAYRADGRRMCDFPEPKELGFGYTTDARNGHGLRDGTLSARMLETYLRHPALSQTCAEEPDASALVELVGLDRVSDVIGTIAKRHLVEYTLRMVDVYRFDPACLAVVPVENIWDPEAGRLVTKSFRVPVADDGTPVLVVPKDIVRSAPPFNTGQYTRFWYGYERPRMTKREVLEDIGDNPQRLLRAMRHIFKDEWRYRPRRNLRDE